MQNNDTIISIRDVSFRYGSQLVLDSVTMDVTRGEFVGLIGPNGSGKTTLLKLLIGLAAPEAGEIRIFGERPDAGIRWRARTGVVPQFSTASPQFPALARDVVEMGLNTRGVELPAMDIRRRRVSETLELVGAAQLAGKPMWDLSGGEQQRINVARALVAEPELLLLDEPTVGVDAHGQDLLYRWINEWRASRSLTVVLISHDVGVIAPLCDKLACLNVQLHFHDRPEKFTGEAVEKSYGCPAEVVFHSKHMPHRVVGEHPHEH